MAPRAKATKPREQELSAWAWITRHARAQIRFLIALVVGVAVFLFVPIEDLVPRILAGWNAGGWLYLLLVAIKMGRAEIEGIKREAGSSGKAASLSSSSSSSARSSPCSRCSPS